MKEEYGVLLDNSFYMKAIYEFRNSIQYNFSNNMILKDEYHNFENRGNFKLIYYYIPLNYNIVIENEIRTFTIIIVDSEQAKNSLYRIKKFENQLSEKNIRNSLEVLKKVLEKGDFNLYLYVNKKLYRKNKTGMKRVVDIRELLNE